ncbi:hypothetical protein KB559_01960 [Paenibacillus sp. Marseille-P2973]|nr:hypothetical protein [Paenibacillus sp. Marseille-P2973]MBQ4897603.1 hypothetical protein [Paenibacillus sp. Marseille-P2973]
MKLAESFAMVALNAQRSLELTMAKKVALRCMAAAVILELHLEGGLQNQVAQMRLKQDTTGGSPEGTYR